MNLLSYFGALLLAASAGINAYYIDNHFNAAATVFLGIAAVIVAIMSATKTIVVQLRKK